MKKLLVVLVILAFVLAGMSVWAGGQKEGAKPVAEPTKEKEAGTLFLHLQQAPADICPLTSGQMEAWGVYELIYDTLVTLNQKSDFTPRLAKSWEISKDRLTYTFHLHDDVKWHDGKTFTARDVEFTYTMMANPKASGKFGEVESIKGAKDYFDGKADKIAGIKILDDYTIRFETEEVYLAFLTRLVEIIIIPEHIFGKMKAEQIKKSPEAQQMPIGTGAYKFVKYVTDQYYEFKRNDDYFRGKPYIEKIYLKISDADVALIMLQKGEIDYTFGVSPADLGYVSELPNVNILKVPNLTWPWIIAVNTLKCPHLADKRIRQAFLYAIDRQAYVDSVLQGNGSVTSVINSEPCPWTIPDDLNKYPYDPEKAKALLKEANWDPKQNVKLVYYPGNKTREQIAFIAQQNLQEVGVSVDVICMADPRVTEIMLGGTYEMILMGAGGSPEPDTSSVYFQSDKLTPDGPNCWYIANKRLDELWAKGRITFDQTKRAKIYKETQKILNDELPWIPICLTDYVYCVNKRVHGVNSYLSSNSCVYYADIYKWKLSE